MASHPPDFAGLLAKLTRALESREIAFMLIGGQAVLLHGRPRLTEDIDLTLAAGPRALPLVLDSCEELGLVALPESPHAFVRDTFVLPAGDPGSGIRIDFIFSTTSYERQAVGRAVSVELRGVDVPFATAEDLIIHKLFAGRARDLEDVESVVRRRGAELDWPYLEEWAARFAEIPGREKMPEAVRELRGRDA